MNQDQLVSTLTVANIVELSSRVLSGIVGNDLSSKVDDLDVYEESEALVEAKLRQRLIAKVN